MFKFRSTKLRGNLQRIRNQFAGRKLTARLSVPPDLQWWYFQEFGTAMHLTAGDAGGELAPGISQEPVASSDHPEGYEIVPVLRNMLSWPVGAGGHYFNFIIDGRGYRFFVPWHPGVAPQAFVRRSLEDIRTTAVDAVALAMIDSGFDYNAIRAVLVDRVLPQAKQIIASNMGEKLAGVRDDGKLRNESAANVFSASAIVRDLST